MCTAKTHLALPQHGLLVGEGLKGAHQLLLQLLEQRGLGVHAFGGASVR